MWVEQWAKINADRQSWAPTIPPPGYFKHQIWTQLAILHTKGSFWNGNEFKKELSLISTKFSPCMLKNEFYKTSQECETTLTPQFELLFSHGHGHVIMVQERLLRQIWLTSTDPKIEEVIIRILHLGWWLHQCQLLWQSAPIIGASGSVGSPALITNVIIVQ